MDKSKVKFINFVDLLIWLQEHNALEAYLNNTKESVGGTECLSSLVKMGIPAPMLLNSFVWAETPEGKEYWQNLEKELLKYVQKKKKSSRTLTDSYYL